MKSILIIALLLQTGVAHAGWFCTSQASERRGSTIVACGKGYDEGQAFDAAKAEFLRVCNLSADCKGHQFIVTPKRVQKTSWGYVRLLSFEILEAMRDLEQEEADKEHEDMVAYLNSGKINLSTAPIKPYTREQMEWAWKNSVH